MSLTGKILNKLRAPGLVRPMRDYHNGVLVEVTNSDLYTKVRVNEREYYFIRESGKFDGWGQRLEPEEEDRT